ncbi:hypothetical protein DL768_003474 [Monosporascus sp. mg162]|nr:hypothetical protein DL768_003474 [Monosporascus sp. mg162]
MEMEYDVSAISALRAKIAKHTIRRQVEQACAARQKSIVFDLHPHPPVDAHILDPQFAPPGLEDVDFGKIPHGVQPQPVRFNIGIVGGGMAGLYASLILQDLGLEHEVIEASNRPGGRVKTHRFTPEDGDYYEVGAILFADTPIMTRTFKLLKLLGIEKDTSPDPKQATLIPYHFSGPNNPMLFNNILVSGSSRPQGVDPFQVSISNGGAVSDRFVQMGYRTILKQVADEWKKRLIKDFDSAWEELMKIDMEATSLRAYLIGKYPAETGEDPRGPYYMTNWCEIMTMGTGYFDVSFLTWLLQSIEFKNPGTVPLTHDAQPVTKEGGSVWWIVNGGSDIVAERLAGKLEKRPLYNYRVTKISRKKGGEMAVTMQRAFVAEPVERVYSHVITTTTAPCLRRIDLRDAGLRYVHREAIRILHYDSGIKVGIKFERRWWAEDKGITKGGIGKTDRPTRIVVYPSHALNTAAGEPGVLMACYNWAQDASRLGALSMSSDPGAQVAIFDNVMADLAAMHSYPEADLRRMVLEYHVHDWDRDPLALSHVASLAPGQFATFFGDMHMPAAEGRLVFAGEIVSIYHGWIVAALNSAYVAVYKLLLSELLRNNRDPVKMDYILQKLDRLEHNWGMADEVESEYDADPKGIAGWQAFLGLMGDDADVEGDRGSADVS